MVHTIRSLPYGFFLIGTIFAACPIPVNNLHGTITHNVFDTNHCNWTFGDINMRTDVILTIKFTKNRVKDDKYATLANGTLPNGEVFEIDKFPLSSSKPWCGMYVKQNNRFQTTCAPGIALFASCQNHPLTTVSNNWPPVIETLVYNRIVKVEYEVFECLGNLIFPATTAGETTAQETITSPSSTALNDLTTNRTEIQNITTAPNMTDKKKSLLVREIYSNELLIPAVLLSVLLLLAVIIIVFLAFKLSSHKAKSDTAKSNGITNDIGIHNEHQSNPYTFAEQERETVNNQIYNSTSDETPWKETVYNQLYSVT